MLSMTRSSVKPAACFSEVSALGIALTLFEEPASPHECLPLTEECSLFLFAVSESPLSLQSIP